METLCRAIFFTLIHSLWQGLVLALLTGLIMVSTKNISASLRYHILTGVLFLFVALVIYTLVIELDTDDWNRSQPVAASGSHNYLIALLFNTIQRHVLFFVAGWFTLVLIKALRLIVGLYTIKRLQKVKTYPITHFWEERIQNLAETMKIKGPVRLFESGIAKVPLLIGYLKPVILVPIGMINSLDPEQVEAILLHELAHIARKDYLVNLIQKIIESLLFFNPAVIWISRLIRSERENCCDDIVVAQTHNQVGYMRALIGFEEYRHSLPDQVMALNGNTEGIPQRIERMISGKNRSLLKLEVILLSLIAIIFVTVSIGRLTSPGMTMQGIPNAIPHESVPLRIDQSPCSTCPYMQNCNNCPKEYSMAECHCSSMVPITEPVKPMPLQNF
ncbi:M56 family metallopeptidase [Flavitalea flava]